MLIRRVHLLRRLVEPGSIIPRALHDVIAKRRPFAAAIRPETPGSQEQDLLIRVPELTEGGRGEKHGPPPLRLRTNTRTVGRSSCGTTLSETTAACCPAVAL